MTDPKKDTPYLFILQKQVKNSIHPQTKSKKSTCNDISDITHVVVSKHYIARNTVLKRKSAHPARKGSGDVAHVTCRCVLGGTLLHFVVRALAHARIGCNDIASRTHEFT